MAKFKIGDTVTVDLELGGAIQEAKIVRIIQGLYRTHYDLEVLIYASNDEIETTLIKEVDEFFIKLIN